MGITAFVIVVSAIWYVRDSQGPDELNVSDVHAALRPNGGDTDLVFRITLDNPTAATASISELHYIVRLNEQIVDTGAIQVASQVDPESAGTVEGSARLPGGFADRLWPAHVERGEATVIELAGNVSVRQAGTDDVLDFSTHDEWKTDLLEAIQVPPKECPEEGADVCIKEIRFYWTAVEDQPALRAIMRIHNPHDFAVRIHTGSLGLTWNDQVVANSSIDSATLIGPGGTQVVDWVLPFDHEALDAWWVRHVEACEESTMTLSSDLAFRGVGTVQTESAEASFAQAPETENVTGNGTDGNGTDDDGSQENQTSNSTDFGQGGNNTGNETGNGTGNQTGNETDDGDQTDDSTDDQTDDDGTQGTGGSSGNNEQQEEDEEEELVDFAHATTWEQPSGTLKAGFPCNA